MSIQPVSLKPEASLFQIDSSRSCSQFVEKHEKKLLGCILGLAGVLTLLGISLAMAFPSAAFIITLSLVPILMILCCLLDLINTKSDPNSTVQPTSFPCRELLCRKNSSLDGKSAADLPTVPKYDDLLTTLWTASWWCHLPYKIRPLPDSVQQSVWRLNSNPGIILISTVGDVTVPRTTSECTLMMVNPTDAQMNKEDLFGGRYPFYKTISSHCWNRAKQTPNHSPILTPGTCSKKCIWETNKGLKNPPNTGLPFYFSHVYNPITLECYDPRAAFYLCKETYIKCFEEAISGESPATMVQMPLLFSEANRGSSLDPEELPFDNPHLKAAKAALVVALQEFSERHPNTSLTIVVVRERGMPIEFHPPRRNQLQLNTHN
ncbi:hypothetical protein [Chlamydia caviae]|uniref:Macro domain-containing protein n=1 Tax=Chlamydia caviae (strain ATCC VR-813 / DSM 19441 / 03DC25 / GPIC) TaxID=227941 RepID=Q823L2_CHLCV|nr:hypothetical protein [Chlamydia caviae]AAP05144.1 conserved hypothetical protein [Chlamydia caviae GPIC]